MTRRTPPAPTLPQERQQWILDRLRRDGRVVAAELAAEYAVTADSLRRDLRELAAQGLCRRVYGGALPVSAGSAPLAERRAERLARKQALARKAVELVRAGQVLLIDAGSTNAAIAAALPARQSLTVITNAPDVAAAVYEREGFEVLLLGGRIAPRIGGTVGVQPLAELRQLHADLCFPGACAFDAATGLWGFDSDEVLLKRAMLAASTEAVVVVTSEKLGIRATHRVAATSAVRHLVVEQATPRGVRAAFAAKGVEVLRAAAPGG